jgi:hypothetical protein
VKLNLTTWAGLAPRRPVNPDESQARKLVPLECDDHRRRAAWSVYVTPVLLAVLVIVAVIL